MADYKTKGILDVKTLEYLKSIRVFGWESQQIVVDALVEHGNWQDAADALDMTRRMLQSRIQRLRRRALKRGYAPDYDMTEPAPEGYSIRGTSTLYRKDPKTGDKTEVLQWVKTKQEQEDKLQALMDAIMPLADDVAGKSVFVPRPRLLDSDLLAIYPMGDPHIGMHAWACETRDRNFNLKLAERNLLHAVNHLVDLAPPASTALVINLGDFFHADSGRNTTTLGTPVDVDGRISKVLDTGVKIMVATIKAALRKHQKVVVYTLIGNHDDLMSVVLSVCLKHHFNNNPRVEVETDPRQHHYYEFGKCLFGMHHGHTTKSVDLPVFMATDMPEAWGRTRYRRFYCGHVHHDSVKELPGCTVETFRTLAPSDAWHAGRYRSGNDMKLDVWHKERGHLNRHIIGIETVLEAVGTEDD